MNPMMGQQAQWLSGIINAAAALAQEGCGAINDVLCGVQAAAVLPVDRVHMGIDLRKASQGAGVGARPKGGNGTIALSDQQGKPLGIESVPRRLMGAFSSRGLP